MTDISMQIDLLDGMGLSVQAKQTLAACQKLHPENTVTLSNLIFILRDGTIYERDGALELSRYLFRLAAMDCSPQAIEKFVTKFCALTLREYFPAKTMKFGPAQGIYERIVHILNINRPRALEYAGKLVANLQFDVLAGPGDLRHILSVLAQANTGHQTFHELLFTACRMGVLNSLPKDPQAFFHPETNYHALADLMADAQHDCECS